MKCLLVTIAIVIAYLNLIASIAYIIKRYDYQSKQIDKCIDRQLLNLSANGAIVNSTLLKAAEIVCLNSQR